MSDILSADQSFADDAFDVGLPVIEFGTYRGIWDDSPIAVILQSPLRDMQRLAYFLRAEPFLPCGRSYLTIQLRYGDRQAAQTPSQFQIGIVFHHGYFHTTMIFANYLR